MCKFFVTVHARPAMVLSAESVVLGDEPFETVNVPPELLGVPFSISFEKALESLSALPRMFIEPDGSFVWVSSVREQPWQVDGVLYDRNERLLFVDLKGSCPEPSLDDLLRACDWPLTRLVFQLTREALFLEETEFRRHAKWLAARPA
jgi:hypothetical protein